MTNAGRLRREFLISLCDVFNDKYHQADGALSKLLDAQWNAALDEGVKKWREKMLAAHKCMEDPEGIGMTSHHPDCDDVVDFLRSLKKADAVKAEEARKMCNRCIHIFHGYVTGVGANRMGYFCREDKECHCHGSVEEKKS